MTVVNQTNIEKLEIFANKKDYSFNITIFPITSTKDYLKVSIQESEFVIIPQVEGVDYNITLFYPQAEGGTITFVPTKILKDNTTLIIERILPLTQYVVFPPNSEFFEKNIEDGLDISRMIDQQLQAEIEDLNERTLPIDEIRELVANAKEAAADAEGSKEGAEAAEGKAEAAEGKAEAAKDEAEEAAKRAEEAAASVPKLPDPTTGQPNQGLIVNADRTKYILQDIITYALYLVETNPNRFFPEINNRYTVNFSNVLQEGLIESGDYIFANSQLTNYETIFDDKRIRLNFYKLFFSEFMGFAYNGIINGIDMLNQVYFSASTINQPFQIIQDPTKYYILKPLYSFTLENLRLAFYISSISSITLQIKFYDKNKTQIYDSGIITGTLHGSGGVVFTLSAINSSFVKDETYYQTISLLCIATSSSNRFASNTTYVNGLPNPVNPRMDSVYEAITNLTVKDLLYNVINLDYGFNDLRTFIQSDFYNADNLDNQTKIITDTFNPITINIEYFTFKNSDPDLDQVIVPNGNGAVTFFHSGGSTIIQMYPVISYPNVFVNQLFVGLYKIEYKFENFGNQYLYGLREKDKNFLFGENDFKTTVLNLGMFSIQYSLYSNTLLPLTFTSVPYPISANTKVVSIKLVILSFAETLDFTFDLIDKNGVKLTKILTLPFIAGNKHVYGLRYLNTTGNDSIKLQFIQNNIDKYKIASIDLYLL